jgi:hypothetical protein
MSENEGKGTYQKGQGTQTEKERWSQKRNRRMSRGPRRNLISASQLDPVSTR